MDDLSENPDGKYKYGSIYIEIDPYLQMFNRQQYGLLDWLGDIGGLIEAFQYLTQFVLKPFLKFSYASFIVSNFFRLKEPDT